MSNELESRLKTLFAELPAPSDAVEERALATSLAALPARHHPHRARTLLLVAAAVALLLAVSAGALAAAGALHVSLSGGATLRPAAATVSRLILPGGAHGIAAVVDGRLWLTGRNGLRIEGLPVRAAALSPHALYVAAGIGDSLVVMAPGGTRAWSHSAGGRVVAIAWAPNGLRIAYVVERAGGRMQLRTIEGDGDHDRLLDGAVRSSTPSWRSDSLAVAYVGAGGHAVVDDFARSAHRLISGADVVQRVSFAPRGRALALASTRRVWIEGSAPAAMEPGAITALAWSGERIAVAVAAGRNARVALLGNTNGVLSVQSRIAVTGRITTLDAAGGRLVVAAEHARAPTSVVVSPGTAALVLLDVPPGSTIVDLAVR